MNPMAINNVMESLKVMGMGMAGIFVVILIFYGLIVGLTTVFPPKPDEK